MVELFLRFDLCNTIVLYKTARRKKSSIFQSDFSKRQQKKTNKTSCSNDDHLISPIHHKWKMTARCCRQTIFIVYRYVCGRGCVLKGDFFLLKTDGFQKNYLIFFCFYESDIWLWVTRARNISGYGARVHRAAQTEKIKLHNFKIELE